MIFDHLAKCHKIKGKKIAADMLLNQQPKNKIVKPDESYYIFHTIQNSPVYYDWKKKEVMAMGRQLGISTLFFLFIISWRCTLARVTTVSCKASWQDALCITVQTKLNELFRHIQTFGRAFRYIPDIFIIEYKIF